MLIVAVFSVQNAMPVAITFFFWKLEASLAIIVFLSALCGAVAGGIMIKPAEIESYGKKAVTKDTISEPHGRIQYILSQ